jgi:predicted O-methyltransferase YrrM
MPGKDFIYPDFLSTQTLAEFAMSRECLRRVERVVRNLSPDKYAEDLLTYYMEGQWRYGDRWRFADLATVLSAATVLNRPDWYLEIGIRRGRSMAIVAEGWPPCGIIGVDAWLDDYAGEKNPGPAFICEELRRVGYMGAPLLLSGDSRDVLPAYLKENKDSYFDLVTVDGDHSAEGAEFDLNTALPRLNPGGIIVMDDIAHPLHRYLEGVWDAFIGKNADILSAWKFTELGYGVAFAIRKSEC